MIFLGGIWPILASDWLLWGFEIIVLKSVKIGKKGDFVTIFPTSLAEIFSQQSTEDRRG